MNYVKSYSSLACNKQKSIDPFGLCTGNRGRGLNPIQHWMPECHMVNVRACGWFCWAPDSYCFHIILTASNQNQRILYPQVAILASLPVRTESCSSYAPTHKTTRNNFSAQNLQRFAINGNFGIAVGRSVALERCRFEGYWGRSPPTLWGNVKVNVNATKCQCRPKIMSATVTLAVNRLLSKCGSHCVWLTKLFFFMPCFIFHAMAKTFSW